MTDDIERAEPTPPRRVPFVVYDQTTGAILRGGICAETDLALQARHIGEAVIEAEADDERHEVRDGRIVARASMADPINDQISARSAAAAYLDATDWIVIRQSETGQPVPDDILRARADARDMLSS